MLYCPRRDERGANRLVARRQLLLGRREMERRPVRGRGVALRWKRVAALRGPADHGAGPAALSGDSTTTATSTSPAPGARLGGLSRGCPSPAPTSATRCCSRGRHAVVGG